MKGLKALEELKFQVGNITYHTHDLQITSFKVRDSGLFEIIEKELKALEIIKKKSLYLDIQYQPYEEKNDYRAWDNELYESVKLTKEEYDLLKEVLL